LADGAAAAAALAAAWTLRRSKPWEWASWLYYLIVLFPLLGFVKTGEAAAANRYTYLACLSWALLAGAALREAIKRRGRTAAALAAAMVLAALGAATRRQIRHWKDSISLWSDAVAVDPESQFAQNNLAFALERAGRAEEAAEHRRLGRLSPASAYHDLGAAYYGRGDWPQAARYFYQAIEIHPALPNTQFDLGLCLFQLGRVDKAIDHIRFAVNLQPADPDFHDGLGVVLARGGRLDEAISEFQQALALKPDFPEAQAALDAVRAQLRASTRSFISPKALQEDLGKAFP
jgi:Flp pilus assembly protein TadD